jgi:glycosyltransferase involved in cell wall biosynthesis
MKFLKILIAPIPGFSSAPAISLLRLERELNKRFYKTSSLLFRIFGFNFFRYDISLMMGAPFFYKKLLRKKVKNILIMGKPESINESNAVGRRFNLTDEADNFKRAQAILDSNCVVFISNYVKNIWQKWFKDYGIEFPSDKVQVIYHGLDLKQFRPKKFKRENDFIVIGSAGLFRTEIRINTIFEVSKRLNFPHKFIISGKFTNDCSKRLKILTLKYPHVNIDILNWTKADNLPSFYNSLDVFLHPVDYEGFGIVISEAMACGVPVVAPCHGAAAEIIKGGGYLAKTKKFTYDKNFFDQLAYGIQKTIVKRSEFSKRARLIAKRNFDIEKITSQYLKIVNQLTNIK